MIRETQKAGLRYPATPRRGSGRKPQGGEEGTSRITATEDHPARRRHGRKQWLHLRLLRQLRGFNVFQEPPCTEPYARWCGRTGGARPPPFLHLVLIEPDNNWIDPHRHSQGGRVLKLPGEKELPGLSEDAARVPPRAGFLDCPISQEATQDLVSAILLFHNKRLYQVPL